MLSLISMADTPASTVVSPAPERSRMDTLLCAQTPVASCLVKEPAGTAKASAEPVTAMAFVRPRRRMAALFGTGTHVAGLVMLAKQQPNSKVNYAHTTRIAALKGSGTWGPHPARDPV